MVPFKKKILSQNHITLIFLNKGQAFGHCSLGFTIFKNKFPITYAKIKIFFKVFSHINQSYRMDKITKPLSK